MGYSITLEKVNINNINDINKFMKKIYPVFKIFNIFIDSKILYKQKVIIIKNKIEIMGVLLYDIKKDKDFILYILKELCVLPKYRNLKLSNILYDNLFNKIKNKKYKLPIYLSSVFCDTKAYSFLMKKYKLLNYKKNVNIYIKIYDLIKEKYFIKITNKLIFTYYFNYNVLKNNNDDNKYLHLLGIGIIHVFIFS